MAISNEELDAQILDMGIALRKKMSGETPGVFRKDYWEGRILEWAMKDQSFKIDMFRFVDVLPVLDDKNAIAKHIKEYLLKEGRELPGVMSAALKAASGGLTAGLGAAAIKKNVSDMAQRFIVGQNAKEANKVLKKLHKDGIAWTVDLLGEATVSEEESDIYAARYMDLIENLADEAGRWKHDEIVATNHLGPIPVVNVSLKISAMYSQISEVDPKGSVEKLKERVLPLFLRAKEKNVFINVDLEQWAYHDITYDLFEEILEHPELKDYPHVGIVIQAYLKSSPKDAERMKKLAQRRGSPITIRLVKGAYWDYETVLARQNGWESPVFSEKEQTDINYEQLSDYLLDNIEFLLPAFGSHNLRSVTHALVKAKEKGVPEKSVEVQMLYGMAEPERKVLRALGHRVRVYAPVGELLPGMAYLVRRLLENTSNDGFLKLSHVDNVDEQELLKAPKLDEGESEALAPLMVPGDLTTPYDNCPMWDFTQPQHHDTMREALSDLKATLPLTVPFIIGSERYTEGTTFERENPSDLSQTISKVHFASANHVDEAVKQAHAAYPGWRDTPLATRAQKVEDLANLLEKDRAYFSALMCLEVGKTWKEADADLAEAVGFCRYYARRAFVELTPVKQGDKPGEDNQMFYQGRGVYAVIAPWNFPLAILCGMAAAALVAGNTVVMKPAEQSSGVAHALFERMEAVGLGSGLTHFLPGDGEAMGPALVSHPLVAGIAFTGSKAVGLSIVRAAGITHPDQPQVKRVVCEMGGKNAIVIDDDSDLDEAVLGVVHSAFGFSGQKCSACSRVFVVGSVYEAFKSRLIEATRSIAVGPSEDPGTKVGPVVDAEARQRLHALIADPGATVLYAAPAPSGGHFVGPTIVEVNDGQHRVMQDEFFGPFVALMSVKTFDDAMQLATATPFALTGAVFSRSPLNLEKARKAFRVGNLYLNTGSTGALVGRQPFGGFGMSGGGTKAGGPNYLLNFSDPRLVTENTMRRGFTPELES